MDNNSDKDTSREEDNLRMDILVKHLEVYRIMASVFYDRLPKEERIDALTEAAEKIREEVLDERKD